MRLTRQFGRIMRKIKADEGSLRLLGEKAIQGRMNERQLRADKPKADESDMRMMKPMRL